jgi:hypothetical protein
MTKLQTTFFNTTNISQSFSRASMTKNTILYGMKDLKGAIGGLPLLKLT